MKQAKEIDAARIAYAVAMGWDFWGPEQEGEFEDLYCGEYVARDQVDAVRQYLEENGPDWWPIPEALERFVDWGALAGEYIINDCWVAEVDRNQYGVGTFAIFNHLHG